MGVLFRIFLIGLIVYLVLNSIASYGARTTTRKADTKVDDIKDDFGKRTQGVPKEVGEYVDYEEVSDE